MLNRMRLLSVFAIGSVPPSNSEIIEKNRSWSVYFGPPVPRLTLNVAVRDNLTMLFSGRVAGAAASVLVDSGASHCFANASFCKQIGLRFTPLSAELQVANGETVPVVVSVRIQVKVKRYTEQLTFFVTDLVERYDIILGDNWMLHHGALLDYVTKSLRFSHNRKRLVWRGSLLRTLVFSVQILSVLMHYCKMPSSVSKPHDGVAKRFW